MQSGIPHEVERFPMQISQQVKVGHVGSSGKINLYFNYRYANDDKQWAFNVRKNVLI